MLLRGSVLKNTKWVLGLTIYVGNETKVMINRSKPIQKISNIEQQLNKYFKIVFIALILISILSGFISLIIIMFKILKLFQEKKIIYLLQS